MTIRTPDEIVRRIEEHDIGIEDFFGFRREVLAQSLPFGVARDAGLVKDGVTETQWNDGAHLDEEQVLTAALDYLRFAFGKAEDHRGISASRSAEKMAEYAWLLGRDDVVVAMDQADYAMYGVPILVAFAESLSDESREVWSDTKNEWLERMAVGLPCIPNCDQGCSS